MRARDPLPWQLPLLLTGLIWGCSFLFIKWGLLALSPVQVAFVRLAIGAATLLAITVLTRSGLPRRAATWRRLTVTALLFCSVPFTLFAYGETQTSSILAGIVNSATPLATLLITSLAFPEARPTRAQVVGFLVGFAGVLVVLGVWNGFGGGELTGVLACVAAITCYGMAFPYSRRHLTGTGDGPLAIASGQVILGALFLVPVVVLEWALGGGRIVAPVPAETVWGMLALGALGSGVAYVMNQHVIAVAGGTLASSVTYLTPLVAVVAGVALLGEALAWNEPVGGLVVLLGVAIAQGRVRLPGR